MSLRLLLDVAGREFFSNDEEMMKKDQLRKDFIKQVKKDFRKNEESMKVNFLSLNQGWLENSDCFE